MKQVRILTTVVAGAALLLAASFATTSVQATPVYTFTTSPSQPFAADAVSYSLGFTFTANAAVTVTSLGFFDDGGNGFLTPHDLGIFLGDGQVGPGPLLASTSLAAGLSGTLGPNSFRYQDLITPLDLIAGQLYTIAGLRPFGPNGSDGDPYLFGGPLETTGFSVNPAITIGLNAARFAESNTLVDPNQHFGDFQFYGVNFEVVPEPTTLALLGSGLLGLAGLAMMRRRKLSRLSRTGSALA